ncbi:MAG: hypothetical protein M0Q26_11045 [Chitinophagaceae bacterium]|nr:hypothetical protein [Chitinophagaceae bacterium]
MIDSPIDPSLLVNVDAFHYENTYRRLCHSDTGKASKDLTFPTMWELFVWGAVLGYSKNSPKEIEKRHPSPPFRWQQIKDPHLHLLIVMAIDKLQSFDILKQPDDLRKNIESFSNGGLYLLHEELALDPLAYQNIESLINQIQSRFTTQS